MFGTASNQILTLMQEVEVTANGYIGFILPALNFHLCGPLRSVLTSMQTSSFIRYSH